VRPGHEAIGTDEHGAAWRDSAGGGKCYGRIDNSGRVAGSRGAVLRELLVGFLHHGPFDADGRQDLHGALGDHRRTRVDGDAAVAFDDQRPDPVMAEQHGRGHSDQAPAHDEDGDLDVRYFCIPPGMSQDGYDRGKGNSTAKPKTKSR
jgi:hypothetical protein